MSLELYRGHVPSNVSKDAKYTVTASGEVRLTYRIDARTKELLTTGEHPQLVEMVNAVKSNMGRQSGGVFYINEWRHVLVKAGGGTWFAGTYEPDLKFDLDGGTVSGRASSSLSPGDPWTGVRVGIKYTLNAAGDDVATGFPAHALVHLRIVAPQLRTRACIDCNNAAPG